MSTDLNWKDKHFAFFQNSDCEYFPCHKTADSSDFSCLFCYCPLYALGDECGGNFFYNEAGIKCCDECGFPHRREKYGDVLNGVRKISEKIKKVP